MIKRLLKIVAIAFFTATFLLVVGLLILKTFGPTYLIPYAINQVEEKTNGRYSLTVNSDSLQISFIDMSVRLGKTEFKREDSVEAYSHVEFLDKFDVHATIESFRINSLNLLRYIISDRIVVDEIRIERPIITIRKNDKYAPQDAMQVDRKDTVSASQAVVIAPTDSLLADSVAWTEFKLAGSKHLPHLNVKIFEITDAEFAFYSSSSKRPIHEIRGFTFDVNGFQLLRKSDVAVEDVFLQIDFASSLISKNTARIKAYGTTLHPTEFHMDSLQFGHVVDKYDINQIKGFRASWLDIFAKDISFLGLDPAKLVNDSIVFIEKVSIAHANLNLFKDKEEPKINPAHKPLPQESIRNISSSILIDTIEISNADLTIDMEAPSANHPGQITFDNTHVMITNITNDDEALSRNADMHILLSSAIYDKIPLLLEYSLDLKSPEDNFKVKCNTEPFDATLLNEFVGSQFFIEFGSGYISRFEFEFDGNNKANVGEMDMEYRDLTIKKTDGYERYLEGRPKTGFIAGVGNMLVPKNRSKEQKGYKKAAIYYEKEYNRDMVHITITSMLSGILSSVGLSSKNIDKKRQQAEALGDEDIEKAAQMAQEKADKVDQKKEKEQSKDSGKKP